MEIFQCCSILNGRFLQMNCLFKDRYESWRENVVHPSCRFANKHQRIFLRLQKQHRIALNCDHWKRVRQLNPYVHVIDTSETGGCSWRSTKLVQLQLFCEQRTWCHLIFYEHSALWKMVLYSVNFKKRIDI